VLFWEGSKSKQNIVRAVFYILGEISTCQDPLGHARRLLFIAQQDGFFGKAQICFSNVSGAPLGNR
jgi:hypothetical protein